MNNEDSGEDHDKYLVGCTIRKYTWKLQNIHDVNTICFWVFLLYTCLDEVSLIVHKVFRFSRTFAFSESGDGQKLNYLLTKEGKPL